MVSLKKFAVPVLCAMMLTASTNIASAKVNGYIVKDSTGNYYEYNVDDLVASIATDKVLFNHYLNNLKNPSNKLLIMDDKKGYIDSDIIVEALVINGKKFDVDKFTETVNENQVEKADSSKINSVQLNDKGKVTINPKQQQTDDLDVIDIN